VVNQSRSMHTWPSPLRDLDMGLEITQPSANDHAIDHWREYTRSTFVVSIETV
jgi:hypothetical protein